MRTYIPLLLLHLLLLQSSPTSSARKHPNIIQETCRSCADSNPALNYNLCVSLLMSNPKSCHANLSSLGVISLRMAIANATNIHSTVQKMLKAMPADSMGYEKSCLEDCLELYSDAVSDLRDSVGAIKSGSIEDARTWISAAEATPWTCEEGFAEGGLASPLKEENDMFFNTVIISLAISSLLDT